MATTYDIAVIPGDATGPQSAREASKVLEAVAERFGFGVAFHEYPFGGDHYLATDELLPDSAIEEIGRSQGVLFGAIGHPEVKAGILEQGILLRLRQELDQYIYLRPVRLYPGVVHPLRDKGPSQIDFVIVRENTAGLYSGIHGTTGRGTPFETAVETMVYNRPQVERCLDYAFEVARRRERRELTLCGKSSVLTHVYDLWDRVFQETGEARFPDVRRQYNHIDEMCMRMLRAPEQLDVVVTGNIFGDILADLGAGMQGGVGIAAGGNINPEGVSMFGPVGGDFTSDVAPRGEVNPIAAIAAAGMLLEQIGETAAAERVEQAIMYVTGSRLAGSDPTRHGFASSDIGDMVCEFV